MKKILNILMLLFAAVAMTSCLEHNLEELDTYEGHAVTGVAGVYYRYYGTDKIPGSGEVQVKQITLAYGNFKADEETGVCEFACKLPSNFPESEKANFSLSNVVVALNISTAAVIKPIDGAPALGKPGDWSKPNKYEVTAANGKKQVWTCTLTEVK